MWKTKFKLSILVSFNMVPYPKTHQCIAISCCDRNLADANFRSKIVKFCVPLDFRTVMMKKDTAAARS